MYAGDFQAMTAGRGIQHSESNPSTGSFSRVYRIGIRPEQMGLKPRQTQERLSIARRRGGLHAVASCGGTAAPLHIERDSAVYSAVLEPGQHIAYSLAARRCAWLHVVDGEVLLDGLSMTAGDGGGIHSRASVSFTAAGKAEVLLIELASDFADSAG